MSDAPPGAASALFGLDATPADPVTRQRLAGVQALARLEPGVSPATRTTWRHRT